MAGYIPQEFIDQLLDQTDIVPIVEQYVKLGKKTGLNYFGLCPFHAETKASFSVTPNKQMFYCYSCQRGGNVINFIQEVENLSFPEAIRFLAKLQGIEVPNIKIQGHSDQTREKRQIQQNVLLEAARFFYRTLESPSGRVSKKYMKDRGYSDETLIKFGIGYADEEWDSLAKHLLKQGFQEEDLLESGIIRKSSRGTLIDLFRNRVVIPIFPSHGNYIIAFGARTLNDEDGPKYLNSPETLLYHKGSNLFALNLVRKLRPLPKTILLTEGYMDTIALHQAGYPNTVAGLGTALTMEQAKLIERYANTLIIAYDSDSAGVKATLKAIDMFKDLKVEVKVLDFADAKDPDNFIQIYGIQRFDALLKEAQSALDFRIKLAKRESVDSEGNLDINQYAHAVCEILAELDSAIMIELYAKNLASEIHVSDKTIIQDIYNLQSKESSDRISKKNYNSRYQTFLETQAEPVKKEHSKNYKYELLFLVLLSSYPEFFSEIQNKFNEDFILSEPLRLLARTSIEAIKDQNLNVQKLIAWAKEIDSKDTYSAVTPNLMKVVFSVEEASIDVNQSLFMDILRRLEVYYAETKKTEILNKLKDKTLNNNEKDKLIKELSEITQIFK